MCSGTQEQPRDFMQKSWEFPALARPWWGMGLLAQVQMWARNHGYCFLPFR